MTYSDDYAAIRAVAARLNTLFGADGAYGANYQSVEGVDIGGVVVVMHNDKNSTPEVVGRLALILNQEDGSDDKQWSSATDRWRIVQANIDAQASGYTGAQVGDGNTTATQERLSKDLVSEFNDSGAWRELGLFDASLRAGKPRADEGETVQVIPHRLTFRYQAG